MAGDSKWCVWCCWRQCLPVSRRLAWLHRCHGIAAPQQQQLTATQGKRRRCCLRRPCHTTRQLHHRSVLVYAACLSWPVWLATNLHRGTRQRRHLSILVGDGRLWKNLGFEPDSSAVLALGVLQPFCHRRCNKKWFLLVECFELLAVVYVSDYSTVQHSFFEHL